MKAPLNTLAALLVAGGASVAIIAAPAAFAQPTCVETGQGGGYQGGAALTSIAAKRGVRLRTP